MRQNQAINKNLYMNLSSIQSKLYHLILILQINSYIHKSYQKKYRNEYDSCNARLIDQNNFALYNK